MKKNLLFPIVAGVAAGILLAVAPQPAEGQNEVVRHMYGRIDFDASPGNQQMRLYHEKFVNGAWRLVALGSNVGLTSEFELWELIDDQGIGDWAWFRGVSDVKVMYGLEPSNSEIPMQDVSSDPEYRRMVHHAVLRADSAIRTAKDPCNNIWPVASGQELTQYDFRIIPGTEEYGMLFKPDDTMRGVDWHWHNPNDIAIPAINAVYLRFTIVFDITDDNDAFEDVHVSWASINYCGHEVCIPSGTGDAYTANWQVPSGVSGRIVLAMPHVHDHVESLTLHRNNDLLYTATPDNVSEGSNHHCPCIRTNRISELTDDNDDECTVTLQPSAARAQGSRWGVARQRWVCRLR